MLRFSLFSIKALKPSILVFYLILLILNQYSSQFFNLKPPYLLSGTSKSFYIIIRVSFRHAAILLIKVSRIYCLHSKSFIICILAFSYKSECTKINLNLKNILQISMTKAIQTAIIIIISSFKHVPIKFIQL